MQDTLFESHIPDLALLHRGKVRDLYEVDPDHLLIVTTDRISAFDVVLPTPIPGKGEILSAISNLWFARTHNRVPNHLTGRAVGSVIDDPALAEALARRAVIVRRLTPLPVEAIVRGYLIGSGWKDYQCEGAICGIPLPRGLRLADKLPEALFTPSTKADAGDRHRSGAAGPQDQPGRLPSGGGLCTRARDHHRRHQVRIRTG
jgi:phosphoribosylaminoimidazole-succinocarboxamide synthase